MADLKLTPAEQNIVKYHHNSIETGNVGDDNGNPVTVWTNTIQIQNGKYKGQFANVPGWIEGRMVEDENELNKYWSKELSKGYWPIYKSGQEADARAKQVHQIMDEEEAPAREVMQRTKSQERPMLLQQGLQ